MSYFSPSSQFLSPDEQCCIYQSIRAFSKAQCECAPLPLKILHLIFLLKMGEILCEILTKSVPLCRMSQF